MNKIKISLDKVDKIKRFGQVARSFLSSVRIMNETKDLDAKSILGLYDINLFGDVYVYIESDNTEEIRRFDSAMEEFR